MLDEKVDLVAGDFNGAAWRRDNRNNVSTIDEAFADCALPMPPAPHQCGDLEQFQVSGRTFVDSSNLLILMDNGKFVSTAHSPFTMKLLVELPSRSLAPPRLCRMAQRTATPRKTRSKDPLERTLWAVPLRQTERTHQRRCERPFEVLVIGDHSPSVRLSGSFQREQRI